MADIMLNMISSLREENRRLRIEIEELRATLAEMYFYGQDLIERIRVEPLDSIILRVESQTSDITHARNLRIMKGEEE